MSDPCLKENEIKNITENLNKLTTNVTIMSNSYTELVNSNKESAADVKNLINILNANILKSSELSFKINSNNVDLNKLTEKVTKISEEVKLIDKKVGDYSMKEIGEKLAVHEDILKGVKWIGGGVILSILGLIITLITPTV